MVVGAGPIGAAAALGLLQQGKRVIWLARQAPVAQLAEALDLRVFAISAASRTLLEKLRVWSALQASRVAPVYRMQIYPQAGLAAGALKLDAYEARTEALAWIVEGQHLQAALTQAIDGMGGSCKLGQVQGLRWDERRMRIQVSLADGSSIDTGLVLGADGAHSTVRELAGLEFSEKAYHKTALIEHFKVQHAHRDIAFQWFGPHGVLALLPLPGPRVSMVWSAPDALAAELQALSPNDRAMRVQAIAGEQLGAMHSMSELGAWPLRLLKLPQTSAPGVLLLGDAAHAVHPLAGQGMNLGFGDVQALLDAARTRNALAPQHGMALGEPAWLRSIARSRIEPVWKMQTVTDQLSALFDEPAGQNATLLGLKQTAVRWGWSAFVHSPGLRRLLVGAAN
jgi:2-polyprenylphenol 6-hydroxylase